MTSRLKGVICYDPGVESNNHKRHHKTGIYSVCAVCSACNAGLSRTSFVVKQLKMNNGNDVVKMTEALPLALLALRAKIATAKNLHPERLGALYPKYCAVMKQIREEKGLSIEELSALSGLSEN